MTKLEELKAKRDAAWGDLRTADAARDAAELMMLILLTKKN